MKIGFQGDLFSNSQEAAIKFSKTLKLSKAEFIPLISSKNVVTALLKDEIQYGVMALRNKIAGIVEETQDALTDKIELVDTLSLHIHHSLFKKNKDAKIEFVSSHIQALNQTKNYRKRYFSFLKEVETEDTALAAQKLSTGFYPENYAVICRKNAGTYYHLFLIKENIEDDKENETIFGLFQLKK